MNPVINSGNILKQVTFSINDDESALSLNLKCHTHALESFRKLIRDLAKGPLLGEKQNLEKKSYFSHSQKPPHLGFLSLEESAQKIERQFRALFFGGYPNTLSTFKVLINNNIFIPDKLNIIPLSSQEIPGTIIQITDQAIHVSTKTKSISLSHFSDLKGNPCSIDALIKRSGISIGDLLQNPDKIVLKYLQSFSSDFSSYEEFWAKEIGGIVPTNLPFISPLLIGDEKIKKDDKLPKEVIISDKFLRFSPNFIKGSSASFSEIFITTFLIYLNRLGDSSLFTIGILNPYLKSIPKNLSFFFPTYLPVTFSLTSNASATDILEYVKDRLASIEKNKAYCEDIYIRYPKLREFSSFLPTIIDIGSPQIADSCLDHFPFVITLDEENWSYSFKIKVVQDDILNELLKNFSEHIKNLFEGVVAHPETAFDELPLLTEAENHQLLIEWNDTKADYPEDKMIHQLFEEQVKQNPDSIAVVYEDEELTYQQLNERANQLAHHLRTLGVRPDTLVAIAVERSLEMIIGLLGILKAGGAYVPLDPTYPQERLQFMLEDTNAPILITQNHLNETFWDYSGTTLNFDLRTENKELLIEERSLNADNSQTQRWISPSAESFENLECLTTPHNLAYVIYTSGSTGKPKGVMVGHNNVVRLLRETQQWYRFTQHDVWTLFHSYAFDFSVWEIWGALSYGGKLVVIPYLTSRSPEAFYTLLKNERITILNQTPSAFQQLIQYEQLLPKLDEDLSLFIRLVIFGGEALEPHKLKPFFDIHEWKTAQLFNMYGITETTVHVTYLPLCKEHTMKKEKSIIGKRMPDLNIYILDTHLHPVPVGVRGEIYIGGAGLARGYLNRPDLTADRFIPNPFVNDEDACNGKTLRLYRTGDLARYLPDGNIEFLGRIDEQVKIRGFRIELGEIESTLQTHGNVTKAVVMARDDESDTPESSSNKKLVAYVVLPEERFSSLTVESALTSSAGEPFSVLNGESLPALTEDLRNHLARSLPDYMVPSFFVYIDKVPLTSNGKIDRKALPAPDLSSRLVGDEYIAPQTSLEQELCSIWKDVLKIDKIGIYDNFFRIGGDSIISIQMVSKARSKGIHFAVKDVFNHPTITGLVSIAKTQENDLALKPDQGVVTGEVHLTPIQHWFFKNNLEDKNHFNQAILLQASQQLDSSHLNQVFSLLLSHHDALRLDYHQDIQGDWIQTSLAKVEPFSVQEIELSHILSETQLAQSIEEHSSLAQQSLNIEKGPLIQVVLFNCGEKRPQRLLIVVHHLAVDGVSWRILLEDLESAYTQLARGENPSLPPKTHSYQQWAQSLKGYASSQTLQEEIPYWKKIVEATQPLPIDFNKGPATGESARTIALSLTEDETTLLLQRVPKAYRTEINDILLTALVLAIGDWTGAYDLSLSLEGHGREDIIKDIDLSRTIGWFTSIFPVHLNIENPNDLAETIKTVKEVLRKIPHKGIGYGVLSYLTQKLSIPISSNPGLSFNYLGQWDNTLTSEGLFTFSQESIGASSSSKNAQAHLLEITGEVTQGILHLFWSYSRNHYHQQTIEKVAHTFIERLKQLIQHCSQENTFGYTPSDFKLANFTQNKLDTSFKDIPHIENIYPLSPMQSGLLFQTLYAPESDAYFVQSIFELEGEIDVSALIKAWQVVSNHHPILRTGFAWQDGDSPLQYVLESAEVSFEVECWKDLTKTEQDQKLEAFIKADRQNRFNLTKAPLFRVTLIQCSSNRYCLIWSQHHILTDGWSTLIILGDVFKAYEALKQGKEVQLTSRPPYRNYIAWLQEQDLDKAEAFWKDYLASLEGPTQLSFSNIIEENQEKDYDAYSCAFSVEETQEIKAFAQQHGLTLNTVIQGAVGLVLKTYTQQEEVVLGVTVSGRSIGLPRSEEMVGLFINTLPLKITSQPTEDTLTFLKNLQDQTQRLSDYAYTPLAQIQSWSGISQSLFDVIFVFENYPPTEDIYTITSDFSIKGFQEIEKTEYPLTISVGPGKQIHVSLRYQTGYFNEEFIKRFSGHIRVVLQEFLHHSNESSQELSLLTEVENHQLLIEWNDTKADYPEDKTIHQLFEEQVKQNPDSIAVVYENEELTYQQLNERANQLAHHLRALGVKPDTLVAIAVQRSLEMIIGLLGILKAGGAYVPLDPSYPEERLRFMLEDTNAPILITQNHLNETFRDYSGTTLNFDLRTENKELLIEERSLNADNSQTQRWIRPSVESFENLECLTTSHNLAYVIYTSGSTGRPKGVMIGHRNLIHYVNHAQRSYSLSNGPTLFHSSPAFDMSITSIFLPLVTGNSIIILPEDSHGNALADILKTQNNFSFIKLTPSHLKTLKSQLSPESIHEQRTTLIVGGENLLKKDIEFWLEEVPNTPLYNEYGPTETTVGCCVFKLKKYHALSSQSVPIGRPISNTQIYILDTHLHPVPVGVRGEIYIGGAGLARGYLNRPDLTADRFIPNPFVNDEDACNGKTLRLYRTGDLARYLPDGNIEFLGRIDEQVKIRGFRIELGEIESTLQTHGDVTQAVVMARDDESDTPESSSNKKLVAYIVPGEFTPSYTELREFLSEKLPDYMVPSFFVYIDKVPLTSNGKIDRKALPAPDLSSRLVGDEYIAPQTSLEQELCSIWKDVLKIDKIGIYDNFFKLGGHSLLATQVISRIRNVYNIDIPLRALFEHPTIESLSQTVHSLKKENILSSLPPLIPMERNGPLPLSFAQQRLWFLDQLLPEMALYNIPSALKLTGNLNTNALESAINYLIQRHESLRTIFPSTEGEAHQEILPYVEIHLTECSVDLTSLKNREQKSSAQNLAQQEAVTPFNLSTDPLIRIKLLILAKEEHILLITLHHIIFDGWSIEVFFKELSELYNAYLEGKEPSLPPLPIQYADFTLWQREWLQGEVLEQQLSYWKQQLADIPDLLELPTDKPRPKERLYQGATYQTSFSKEIKDQLNQLSQQHGTSLFMTLLAAFQVLLYRYTGQKDIVVGSPIANRHYKEIEGLIGFFVNTLALRTTFEDHESFTDILNKVKETTLQAYQHQDVPFEQLVDHLNIPRILNRNPVFQVTFTFQNSSQEEALTFKQIEMEPFDHSHPIAKFDLSLSIHESDEGFEVGIAYAVDLFEARTIERMGDHFKELIEGILRNPTQNILELSLLTETENHQLLIEWNDTKADYPEDKMIHQLFEEQVKQNPDSIAVVYEDEELTYQQLNERANQLAHHLRVLGVRPDTLVAIAVERSLEMIIGLLGILKAGGAYVPLDPNYPEERLRFMLEDTNAPILITQVHLQEKIKAYSGITLNLHLLTEKKELFIEEKSLNTDYSQTQRWINPSAESFENPECLTTPHNLAYVIYTSGSTGKPKGSENTHDGLTNHLLSTSDYYIFSLQDSLLLITSVVFDISIWEILLPLINGASLIIASEEEKRSIPSLGNLINKRRVTTLFAIPSLFNLFVSSVDEQTIHSLKRIVTGGEALSNELRKELIDTFKNTDLFLAYGPTEATISVTHWNCRTGGYQNKTPIGRPISNTQIYILDTHLNPVPVGVRGEIYIGGAGLARGYLNRPDLTADRFIPNPFVNDEDACNGKTLRLYRTGDLARYLPDGNIEFLGRIDEQVKIRGFRIELGEIESTLQTHGNVTKAVVMARDDESDTPESSSNKKLVAYVVLPEERFSSLTVESALTSSAGEPFSVLNGESLPALTEDLRNHLARSLPDYMVPSFFVYIDKVPLTSNGKIDRKALPAPDLSSRLVGDEYIAPQTSLEQELCSIWKDVLKIDKIGIYDNFFRIGGDSIISIQMVSKARSKGIHFAVKDVFNHPTITGLVSIAKTQENDLALKPDQGVVTGEVHLTPIQHWFFKNNLEDKNHFNQAILLQASQQLDSSHLNQVFSLLLSHHDALRLDYHQDIQGDWIQTSLAKVEPFSVQEIELSHILSETQLAQSIEEHSSLAQQSLNIEKGPLIQVVLFNCGEKRPQRLLIVVHHLAVDGVSWRILLEDLESAYTQLARGENPSLPPKTHSYQQWAQSLKGYASSQTLQEEIPYWKKIVEATQPLPIDFNKGPATGESARTIALSLTEDETTLLLQRVPKAYRTEINDILLTALVLAIGDWTGAYDLSLSLEGHGREDIIKDIDLSRTIGWFTSIFPVHLNIENPNDLAETIKTVKEDLRKIPRKGVGYGILSYLENESSLLSSSYAHPPRPTISFNYLGQWDNAASQTGLFASSQESAGRTSSSKNIQAHLLEITGEVTQGILHFFCSYSRNHYHQQTIEKVAHKFIERLKQLIQHCSQENTFGYTPSDFKLANFTQNKLDTSFKNIPHIENIYPLSPMQSGLLFQTLYAPESDAYFVQSIFELEGEIDVSALIKAWQVVSDHHPILRTGFIWQSLETSVQYVLKSTEVPFETEDWQDLGKPEQEKKLEIFIREDRKKGFDLRKAPLLRLILIQCSSNRYYLIWSQHHILTDGWSTPIILGDVFKAYEALRRAKEVQLTSRSPYQNYIAWLQEQDLNKAEAFWKDYLASLEGPTQLSFSNIIEENQEKDYDAYSCAFSVEETQEIKAFAQQHDLTLNTVIQGAVGLVLKTYTQQEEVVLGVTVSGRSIDLPRSEEMVGLFINTLPLKITSQPTEDTLTFLKNLQEQTQRLSDYAYTPLAQIQSWSGINQSLFDVILVFQNYPFDEKVRNIASDFVISGIQGVEKTEYPLTVVVGPGNQIHITLRYQTEHFNEELLKRFSDHIRAVLQEFLLHSKENPHELPLLTEAENHQLLIEWNDTKADYPEDKMIHQLFEEQVKQNPDSIAVVYEDEELTYQQLNERANQLAHHLRALGVRPDTLVAIAVERSLEMIIGLLGILKAGGAYVPLDPSYPEERLRFMLEDTNAPILITQAHLQEKFKVYSGITLNLHLRTEKKELFIEKSSLNADNSQTQRQTSPSAEFFENPECLTTSHNLAYVIYTSGSTGRPKGVAVENKGLVNYTQSILKNLGKLSSFKFAHVSTFAADLGNTALYPSLLSGSCLHILGEKQLRNPQLFRSYINQHKIDCLKIVPAHFDALSTKLNISEILPQHSLLFGGDNFDENLLARIREASSLTLQVFNHYGPTESTVGCCILKVEDYRTLNLESISIGKPIENVQIYILDKYLNPVPVGVGGEIYIGGAGLARGYLNRPDVTADRFIPNPFMNQENRALRLYRTGDLARYLPGANIEFLGRIDDQVKIQGFRIELGEIESTLQTHGDVTQAVVVAKEDESDKSGNKKLAVYVVIPEERISSLTVEAALTSSTGEPFSVLNGESLPALTEDLRNHLARSLPDYMVPSFFVYIDKVPLTSNGKIDLKALLSPPIEFIYNNRASLIYPATPLQFQLLKVWEDVLKLKNISIHDNFFEIGGNSLISIKVFSQLESEFSNKITIADIFRNPTIYSLSRVLELERCHIVNSPLFPIQITGKGTPLFLIHPGGGLSFCYMELSKYINDIPIYGINSSSFEIPENNFNTSIEIMAKHYISLIKKTQKVGPYLFGGWSFGGMVAYEMAQQLAVQGESVGNLILIDVGASISNMKVNNSKEKMEEAEDLEQEKEDSFFKKNPDLYLQPLLEQNRKIHRDIMCKYKIKEYRGKVTLLRAIDNILKVESEAHDMGWGYFIKDLKIIDVPGKHEDLFKHDHIESTANAIKTTINSTCFDGNLFEKYGEPYSQNIRKKTEDI